MEYRRLFWILPAAALAAACASSPAPREAAAPSVTVRTARAELVDLPSFFEAGGVVRARLTSTLSSRVLAPIVDVRVRGGDHVRRGDPLVALDSREPAANRDRSLATRTAAEQAVTAAEADGRAADAALTLARATHTRIEALHAKRSATSQEFDEATAALAAAESRVAGATARLSEAHATLDAARASAVAAALNVQYATIAAPFDGLVTERLADPGTMAAPGVPLLTIEDPSGYRLEVRLDEARAAGIRVGDIASVHLDGVPDAHDLAARVGEIARLDPASHSFLVKIDLPAVTDVRSGLFGTARFAGASRRALAIPATAIVTRGQLAFVFAVDDRTARLRPISTATPTAAGVEVLAGLRAGDQIVIDPPAGIADGVHVRTGESR